MNKAKEQSSPNSKISPGKPFRGSGYKVLVVDDDGINRILVNHSLSPLGFLVDVAENGKVAIDKAKQKSYDFILMDLQMPVMDGYSATTIIRDELKLKTPIIAFSGSVNKNEIMQCYKSGMMDYIIKPFTTETLTNTLYKHKLNEPRGSYKLSPVVNDDSGKAQLYSLDRLTLTSQGNNLFVKKMVRVFCDTMPQQVRSMVMALNQQDYPTIKSIAHKIKPAIDYLCIESLATVIRNLENLDPAMLDWAKMQRMIAEIRTTLTEVIEGLSEHYQLRING